MTPYELLGVAHDATPDQIRKAFRKKAKEHHPDLHGNTPAAEQHMKRFTRAYETLHDPATRAELDKRLRRQRPTKTPPEKPSSRTSMRSTEEMMRDLVAAMTPRTRLQAFVGLSLTKLALELYVAVGARRHQALPASKRKRAPKRKTAQRARAAGR